MPGIIQKRVIEEIRFRNDVVDVVGSYLTLKRAGSTFKALCPFHKEKTPSFHVNPERQIFHCFGCGVGGDVFGFVMQYEGVDFVTAAEILADRAGLKVEYEKGTAGPRSSEKDTLYRIHREVAAFYQRCLLQTKVGGRALQYLEERDVTRETIEAFGIGYAPNRWDTMLQWARKHKTRPEDLEKAGLLARSQKEGSSQEFYDRFRDRVMFPIWDTQGRIVAFSGRALQEGERTAKYVNSPETPLFRKGRILYALDKARRHIVESREAILCEGQIDVIRCHVAGFGAAVACQGTAFTADHAQILSRYADSVIIVFDPDTAGENAAVKTARLFMSAGLAVRVARLPQGQDPDTYIREEGAEAFRALLAEARPAVQYQVDILSDREDASSEAGIMRISRQVLETIASTPNAVQRAKLLEDAARHLGLPVSALQSDFRGVARRTRTPRVEPREAGDASQPAPEHPAEEVGLCEALAAPDDELVALVRQYLPLHILSDAACRAIVTASLEAHEQGSDPLSALQDGEKPGSETLRLATAVQMAPEKTRGADYAPVNAVRDLILRIWRRHLRSEQRSLPPDARERHVQITYDLSRLKQWTDGATIIELEMSGDGN